MKTILVTGANGLVGSAIRTISANYPYNFIFCSRQSADLTKENEVKSLFQTHKPDYVIHAAAKVGGVGGNARNHGVYFYENILMNAHVIHHAYLNDVQKLLVFSSVCAFPDDALVINETLMHQGEPFAGNFAYGYAKRMVDVQISAYKSQYGINNYCSIIPGNIFGEKDYYNLENGHVLPSLIHKLFLAKKHNTPFKIWGDGSAQREFIYAKDLATIIMKIISLDNIPQRIIVSGEEQFSIKDIIHKLCKVAKFEGQVQWETDKPNGVQSRSSDLSLLRSLIGDLQLTDLEKALQNSYEWFAENWPNIRM